MKFLCIYKPAKKEGTPPTQQEMVDGPFTEAKEVVGGFALIQVPSKEAAIEVTKSFMNVAGDGETEIRQIFEQP
jgi:hypothetical protein